MVPFNEWMKRLAADKAPTHVDAIYVPGRSHGDYRAVLNMAVGLHGVCGGCPILLTDTDGKKMGGTKPREACPGFGPWRQELLNRGVANESVLRTQSRFEPLNSKQEGDALLDTAAVYTWRRVLFVTNAHQLSRFFLGVVASLQVRQDPHPLKLYASCPPDTDWNEVVHGSQGADQMPRAWHVAEEAERIANYQAKGDLGKWEDLDAYLMQRDSTD